MKKFEFQTYLKYVARETINFQVYLTAGIIGSAVCYFTDNYTAVPFLVPFFVQTMVRSGVKFKQRHQAALVELPAQTQDPAFIMDMHGNIVLSIGNTLEMFEKYSITHIQEFLNEAVFETIIHIACAEDLGKSTNNSIEAFSNRSLKWYEIKAKKTGLQYGNKETKVLVWLQDISLRKIYQLRLKDLLRYSDTLITSLEKPVRPQTAYELLAAFLLKEYEAVFITRADKDNNLNGYVFKNDLPRMIKSDMITVSNQSPAPINISRKKKQIISNDVNVFDSYSSFLENNPFDPVVLDFIAVPIRNFITYNKADISIIAFNFKSAITEYEKQFFEVVVNFYRTMIMMVDLKKQTQDDVGKIIV